jgi:hypothetical protein
MNVTGEQGQYGVRANWVCPGPIDTSWTRAETGPMDDDAEETVVMSTALGRRATTEEEANVYAFLTSNEASYVTGALWLVDGATTIVHGMPAGPGRDRAAARPPAEHLVELCLQVLVRRVDVDVGVTEGMEGKPDAVRFEDVFHCAVGPSLWVTLRGLLLYQAETETRTHALVVVRSCATVCSGRRLGRPAAVPLPSTLPS